MLRVKEATPMRGDDRSRRIRVSAAPPSVVPLPLQGGERLGPYRLCFEIASGGMATVYLARVDLLAGIHRFVALKRIHPHLMKDPVFLEMFLDEARIASQINHANVCSVFDFGVADSVYFIAMEYLSGGPLSMVRRTLLRCPVPLETERLMSLAVRIIADAAEGIHAAHELCDPSGAPLNVVHRDVSPDNVFLTYDGVVKIVDFGVARATRQKHKTRSGVLKGKFAYIQPEVLLGSQPDRRADVWGLGVILWELLTLKRLFLRKTEMETLRAVLRERIPAPSELRPDVPRELDEIVARALARDPAERYQTARELGRDLTRFLAERRTAVGLAELSDLMGELFPGGRARKLQLLEIAERIDAKSDAESCQLEVSTRSAAQAADNDELDSCLTRIRPTPGRSPSFLLRRRIGIVATAALSLVVLGAVFSAKSFSREADAPPVGAPRPVTAAAALPQLPTIAAPRAPGVDPAPAEESAASKGSSLGGGGNDRAVPIQLAQGAYVVEIAPNANPRSDGVMLLIRRESGGGKARAASASALGRGKSSPAAKPDSSVPQPLPLEALPP